MKKILLTLSLFMVLANAYAQQQMTSDTLAVPARYQNIHRRSPVLSCLLSVYIPGLGQVYNKEYGKGAIVFGTTVLSLGAAEIYHSSRTHPENGVTAALLAPLFAAYLYSAIDAPVSSVRLNRSYHLGKHPRELSVLQFEPAMLSAGTGKYTAGLSLVIH
ncbi:hypothetical protein SAMN05216464_10827 [Mucilaginibacter pineti]|uniref:DUF5683 domain-containing protein n=1 Tax=Mucilaginibacter pineti TaxID=1391627 RepID=A0A1G7EHF9_9SPHI|nr:DUF5683 domain-containing protein [Mucilaginibacter pineti]SDE63088.1 hypothetical protein SAMN05216464_10827 [Mucilaginibacter pineti]